MKYFLDTEFIEDGSTIDLISIGLVAEDGRTLYRQNLECRFQTASEWVWRNVFPHLEHFHLRGERACSGFAAESFKNEKAEPCINRDCPWRSRSAIRDELLTFCSPEKFGKPEFWGYYADYDWVAFCQLFGPMIALPKGFPMYCRDIKQLCDDLGNPTLPKQTGEHNALADAKWNQQAYEFLRALPPLEQRQHLGA